MKEFEVVFVKSTESFATKIVKAESFEEATRIARETARKGDERLRVGTVTTYDWHIAAIKRAE